jgi:hypothetical protein
METHLPRKELFASHINFQLWAKRLKFYANFLHVSFWVSHHTGPRAQHGPQDTHLCLQAPSYAEPRARRSPGIAVTKEGNIITPWLGHCGLICEYEVWQACTTHPLPSQQSLYSVQVTDHTFLTSARDENCQAQAPAASLPGTHWTEKPGGPPQSVWTQLIFAPVTRGSSFNTSDTLFPTFWCSCGTDMATAHNKNVGALLASFNVV